MARDAIVLVTGNLQAGGAERVLADMAGYWAKKGLDVTCATWAGREVADFYRLEPAVRRVWLDLPGRTPRRGVMANLARVRKLRALVRKERPRAVLSFIHTSNVLTILACTGLPTRVVVSERMQPAVDPTASAAWRILRSLTYRWSEAVVAQSRDAAGWIRKHCGTRAVVIPNPLRELPPPGARRDPIVLAVGRLSRQKGFDLLLRAFASIAAEFPEWRLAIAGDGPERAALHALRDELGLGGRAEFIGQVRNVEEWMSRAGLVVQPSRYEGFPNVLLESMGMGAAVIAADCPAGPAELIEDGVNGRLVPVEDVAALRKAMAELMSQPVLRESLGREACRVRERFGQERVMAEWEACLGLRAEIAP